MVGDPRPDRRPGSQSALCQRRRPAATSVSLAPVEHRWRRRCGTEGSARGASPDARFDDVVESIGDRRYHGETTSLHSSASGTLWRQGIDESLSALRERRESLEIGARSTANGVAFPYDERSRALRCWPNSVRLSLAVSDDVYGIDATSAKSRWSSGLHWFEYRSTFRARLRTALDRLRLRRHAQPLCARPRRQGLQQHAPVIKLPRRRDRGRPPRAPGSAEQLDGVLLDEAGHVITRAARSASAVASQRRVLGTIRIEFDGTNCWNFPIAETVATATAPTSMRSVARGCDSRADRVLVDRCTARPDNAAAAAARLR